MTTCPTPSPFSVGLCSRVFVVAQSDVNVAPSEPSSSEEEEEEEKSGEQSSEGSSGKSSGREGESEDDLLDF